MLIKLAGKLYLNFTTFVSMLMMAIWRQTGNPASDDFLPWDEIALKKEEVQFIWLLLQLTMRTAKRYQNYKQ